MPARLPHRCGPDCVNSFRMAAPCRYRDGLALAESSHRRHRTAAIYLWGYSVEMTLKAAVFRVLGHEDDTEIRRDDLRAATQLAVDVGFEWTGGLHSLQNWGRLLVLLRITVPDAAYAYPGFGGEVLTRSLRIHDLWREWLRYHANTASSRELIRVREQTEWFLQHARAL